MFIEPPEEGNGGSSQYLDGFQIQMYLLYLFSFPYTHPFPLLLKSNTQCYIIKSDFLNNLYLLANFI